MKGRSSKEIKADIRSLKKEMKDSGIRTISFMNAGLDPETYRCNARLFALKTELLKSQAHDSNEENIC